MEYTSDSDLSEDTRDSVSQGLASVKRKRKIVSAQSEGVRERFPDSNMDLSSVRHPSWRGVSNGDTSTHGLATTGIETVISQNHNIGTLEVGLEVLEPRSARKESSRRSGRDRELTNDDMRIAYDELEREMNELRNNVERRVNPSDTEVMNAWRERVEVARAEAFGDLEERAMKLAESAGRVRERRYAGARVIEVAPIREVAANVNATDVQEGRTAKVAHKRSSETPERAETSRVRTKTVKTETACENKKVKTEKKEKIEASEIKAKTRTRERKVKSVKKIHEPSTSGESSEEEKEVLPKRTSHDKEKRVKSKNKHRSSDTEEDTKKLK